MKQFTFVGALLAMCLFVASPRPLLAQAKLEELKDVDPVKIVFDFTLGDPKKAAVYFGLIKDMQQELTEAGKHPSIAVVFRGPAVKLMSTNRESFGAEDYSTLDQIAGAMTELSKSGVGLELCLFAAKHQKVEPSTVFPEIKRVANGWYSTVAHQAHGYALVPVN
jgi:intracellular sulfur oxidation DsrE/DsrF family protein